MVAEYDRATEPGERGALLRREGLYHSHIIEWRKARDAGTLVARPAGRRSRKPSRARRTTRASLRGAGDAARHRRAGRDGAAAAPEREAGQRPGPDPGCAGDHGKSTRALGTALRERGPDARAGVEQVMDETFAELVDAGWTCAARASWWAGRGRRTTGEPGPGRLCRRSGRLRPTPANALTEPERDRVLALLRDPSFVDKSPAQVWAHLLDDGIYLCSQSTMYRILRAARRVA